MRGWDTVEWRALETEVHCLLLAKCDHERVMKSTDQIWATTNFGGVVTLWRDQYKLGVQRVRGGACWGHIR